MLNIADLNIYLYQKTHLIKCFGCWLHARISRWYLEVYYKVVHSDENGHNLVTRRAP